MSYLLFMESGSSPSGKTRPWSIHGKNGGSSLGVVSWYAPWRRYTFAPGGGCVFDAVCLREVADFCERETIAHIKGRQ